MCKYNGDADSKTCFFKYICIPKICIHIIIQNINLVCIHLFGTLCIGTLSFNSELNPVCRLVFVKSTLVYLYVVS
jgi:hypothetical protein